jgi:hypothetical protein
VRDVDVFLNSVGSPVPIAKAAARRRRKETSQQLVRETTPRREASESSEAGPKREIMPVEHSEARGGELLSLASVHSVEELRSWWERAVLAHVGDVPIVAEPKVDGLTMRVSYDSGKLVEVSMSLVYPRRARDISCVWEPMFDGSVYPNNLMQMFEYSPVLRYSTLHNQTSHVSDCA